MVNVTPKYRAAMDSPVRTGAYARVEFDVIDPGAAAAITGRQDNGHVWYSTLEGIEFDRVPEATYSTFEPNRWLCDGSQLVAGEASTVEQGYASNLLSNFAGAYPARPVVRFDFGSLRSFKAVTLWFDPSCEDFPALVRATGYRDGAAVVTKDAAPDSSVFVIRPDERRGFKNVDRLDITFLEAGKPYRRARLQSILFGYTQTIESNGALDNGRLESISCSADSDPLCREIAYQDAQIKLIDHEGIYAIDNPEGIWEDIEERIPVRIYFGVRMPEGSTWGEVYDSYTWREVSQKTWREIHDGGFYETFLHGSYWLDSQPATDGRNATFNAVSIVDLLDADFKRWPSRGGSLYDLATLVLESVDIPKQRDGGNLWYLWEGLRALTTTAPMEIKSGRTILQEIAIAGRCTMFFDRYGALHIEPLPTTQYDFTLDFEGRQIELPKGEKVPALGGVEVSAYKYTAEEAKELHTETYTVAAGEIIEIELSTPAINVSVSGGGSAQIYSSAIFVSFPTAGSYTITVTGQELEETATITALPVANANPASTWATLENKLIVSAAQASLCGQWYMDYLRLRLTYRLQSVGFPELDIYDKIYSQSRFNEQLPAWIIEHSVLYNGGFRSQITAKVDIEQ